MVSPETPRGLEPQSPARQAPEAGRTAFGRRRGARGRRIRPPDLAERLTAVSASLAAALFLLAFRSAGIAGATRTTAALLRKAAASLADPGRSDREKARLARRDSLRMLGRFAGLTGRLAAALAAPTLVLLALDAAGISRIADAAALLAKWETAALAAAAYAVGALVGRRRPAA